MKKRGKSAACGVNRIICTSVNFAALCRPVETVLCVPRRLRASGQTNGRIGRQPLAAILSEVWLGTHRQTMTSWLERRLFGDQAARLQLVEACAMHVPQGMFCGSGRLRRLAGVGSVAPVATAAGRHAWGGQRNMRRSATRGAWQGLGQRTEGAIACPERRCASAASASAASASAPSWGWVRMRRGSPRL